MLDKPYAELASLSYRQRMELLQAPKKFCGNCSRHESHGWVCERKQMRCLGFGTTAVKNRLLNDPVELVRDLALGRYADDFWKRT